MEQKIIKKNNVRFLGNGSKTILFVHGYGCDQSMWRYITPSFENDYKIILIDLVGSGYSDTSFYDFDKYTKLDAYADDIIEICYELKLSNVILVGHSVSATICTIACNKAPKLFDKLIMICPSPKYINDEGYLGGFTKADIDMLLESLDTNHLTWSHNVAPLIMSNNDRPELKEEWETSFCRMNPSISKHFAKVIFLGDNRKDFLKLKTQSLTIQSKNDSLVPLDVRKYLDAQMLNSTLTVLDTSGHCPHLSNPDLTIKAMRAFLN